MLNLIGTALQAENMPFTRFDGSSTISVRNGPGRLTGFQAGFGRPGRAGNLEARAKGGRPGL